MTLADRDPLADVMADWWDAGPVPATHEDDASLLREILARHGLAVVPVEPTIAVCRRGFSAHSHDKDWREVWRAMVAAAQQEARDAAGERGDG